MKIFIFVLFTLLSANVSAGPYVDFGLGYIKNLPSKSEGTLEQNGTVVVRLNDNSNVQLDSPFIMIRGGYRFETDNWSDNVHMEYDRFGLLDQAEESISSWRIYKRLEVDRNSSGFYLDLGIGGIINAPEKQQSETEREGPIVLVATAQHTLDIDSPFPMARVGYNWKSTNLHFEYERFGELQHRDKSISNIRLYKRWEWK